MRDAKLRRLRNYERIAFYSYDELCHGFASSTLLYRGEKDVTLKIIDLSLRFAERLLQQNLSVKTHSLIIFIIINLKMIGSKRIVLHAECKT